MTEQEARHEAEELLQLFLMCCSSKEDAKKCAVFSVKREIELLEKISQEKFIVYHQQERFNMLLQNKHLILAELKKI
jgi:hypothetical protein